MTLPHKLFPALEAACSAHRAQPIDGDRVLTPAYEQSLREADWCEQRSDASSEPMAGGVTPRD